MKAALFALLLMVPGAAMGEDLLPAGALQPYGAFRDAMMKAGWIPAGQQKADDPVFDEITCAREFCFARWAAPTGWQGNPVEMFMVLPYTKPDGKTRDFRLAPDISAPWDVPATSN